jgi:hypothetical protein
MLTMILCELWLSLVSMNDGAIDGPKNTVVLWSVNFDISVYNPTLAHKYLIGLKNT